MIAGKNILFLGAGSMAEAVIRGLLTDGTVLADQIHVVNRSNKERMAHLVDTYGVNPVADKKEAVHQADIIVVAVKPNGVVPLLCEIKEDVKKGQILISFAAGISIQMIEEQVGKGLAVVRVMPNTACAVLQSATAVSFGSGCDDDVQQMAIHLLQAVGTVSVVDESLMDAVTGLSGSGPAYFYYFVEAMVEAGKNMGLPEDVAKSLVVQTIYGAGSMLLQTGLSPAVLRQQVTSPNGTTMAGLEVLQSGEVDEWLKRAVKRAAERSWELGQEQMAIKG